MLYEIILDENKLNEYQIGRVNGIIYVLSGMPEKRHPIKRYENIGRCRMFFESDEETLFNIRSTIDKLYPGAMIEENN